MIWRVYQENGPEAARHYMFALLWKHGGSMHAAARDVGCERRTLSRWCQRLELTRDLQKIRQYFRNRFRLGAGAESTQ